MTPAQIKANIESVIARISQAESAANRTPGSVKLMLAAKYQPVENILAAIDAGQTLFGHNLVHQLLETEPQLTQIPHITTMIGHVQSNKLSHAMQYAQRIDTVDTFKLAERINRRQEIRIENGEAVGEYEILLQVNSSGADSQYGCNPNAFLPLAEEISQLKYVKVMGLMTIGANTTDESKIIESFEITRKLSAELQKLPNLSHAREISMGMTGDLELAVAHGSTVVRVGTAIFGARVKQ